MKMKIKTISRLEEDYCRQTKHDINKVHRNRDPALHPFERAREYTKAVVATKLDKIFAKPFVGALDGHVDAVYCMSTVRNKVVPLISGSCDGEIKVWDLSRRTCFWSSIAHTGFVRGIAPDESGNSFYTCGDDRMIKQWALLANSSSNNNNNNNNSSSSFSSPSSSSSSSSSQYNTYNNNSVEPIKSIIAPHPLKAIDHHWVDKQFATVGETLCIWDGNRTSSDPIHSYSWGCDSLSSVKYNPAEASLVASTGVDRSICLYDLRAAVPMRKFMLAMKSNKVIWNPMEPFNFLLANEDHNVYTFDMRNLNKALMIHKDHVGAVMDIAFSPTGREFVSGGYDNTIRLFKHDSGRSHEVYHTKRMQHIFSVSYSVDSQYVLTGSDDTNIRIWKTNASQSMGIHTGREDRKMKYNTKLKERFHHLPEIQRIVRDKKIPKFIKKAKAIRHIQNESVHRKQENRKRHSKEGENDILPERSRAVIKEFV